MESDGAVIADPMESDGQASHPRTGRDWPVFGPLIPLRCNGSGALRHCL